MATLVLAGLAGPAAAVEHDFCVDPAGDAGDGFKQAGRLASNNCLGEMLVNADPNDWYFVKVAPTSSNPTLSVTLCLLTTKTAPWNADLEIYFLPLGQILEFQETVFGIPVTSSAATDPGQLMGSSNNAAGCDSVSATAPQPAALGKWYINVIRASGDGFYNLATTST